MRVPDGTVIDGEIVVMRDGRVAPFAALQTRIGRKRCRAKILAKHPPRSWPIDLLEARCQTCATSAERRSAPRALWTPSDSGGLQLSPLLGLASWNELRDAARRVARDVASKASC